MSDRKPNILLITTDQQRHDAMGIAGNPVLRTPNLDALAASGTRFERCYVTCPVCIPARRTLISGLHPRTHGMLGYRDGWDFDPPATLPGALRDAGYQTQLVGKLHLHPQRKRFGFDHVILSESANDRPTSPFQRENDYATWLRNQGVVTRGNAHGVTSNSRVGRPFHLDEHLHHSNWVAQCAADFFEQWRDPTMPWFMHVSFVVPHPPLTPPQAYWDRYANGSRLSPTVGEWAPRSNDARRGKPADGAIGPFPADEIHDAIAGYYGLINHVDDQISYLLSRFFEYANPRAREPTYIIFTSDHGEMLGDHHLFRKSLAYEASAHVPLLITGRNVDMPRGTSDALATWEDIMPTILDLAGVAIPDHLDGRSLVPVMRGESNGVRETVFGMCHDGHAHDYLVHGRNKYIRYYTTGEEQVFDLSRDPNEISDLSGDADAVEPLRRMMDEHLESHDAAPGDDAVFTPCANKPPRALWSS